MISALVVQIDEMLDAEEPATLNDVQNVYQLENPPTTSEDNFAAFSSDRYWASYFDKIG
jgi:hypothetical protein